MGYMSRCDLVVQHLESRIAFLQAVCRIAANKLKDGGTFPVNGETWSLLDYAAGDSPEPANDLPPQSGNKP